jgi:hypothetical protein
VVVAAAVVVVADVVVAEDAAVAPAVPVALPVVSRSAIAVSAEARHLPIARQSRRSYWPGSIIDPAISCVCAPGRRARGKQFPHQSKSANAPMALPRRAIMRA